jgi:hypothetical protein
MVARVLETVAAGDRITAEDVKTVLQHYAAQQFGGRCEVASAVFGLKDAEPEMLVTFPPAAAPPPRLIRFAGRVPS